MRIAKLLWSETSRTVWLLLGAAALVLAFLGTGELWTHEGRWAAICLKMMQTGNYVHPYHFSEPYYDKPLLTYWIMIGFGRVLGFNEWAMRLPTALSAVLAVWCTYRLGARLFDRATGLLAGWILASCGMFVFQGRVAASDMMNLCGIIAAVAWYFERRERPGWTSHLVFWLILAVGCQTKGLVCAAVAILVLLPDLLSGRRWRTHLKPSLFLTALPALAIYLVPFLLSKMHPDPSYQESGLAQVFRENIKRFFDAYDHRDPPYLYLIWIPVYLLPWTALLPFAIWRAARRWKTLGPSSRWVVWAVALIFLFFTASTSRRPYYILPILPFAALMIADWIRPTEESRLKLRAAATVAGLACFGILAWYCVCIPYSLRFGGFRRFAADVRVAAEARAPWQEWTVILVDVSPHSAFYLRTGKEPVNFDLAKPDEVTKALQRHPRAILVTRRKILPQVKAILGREVPTVYLSPRLPPFLRTVQSDEDAAVALIP
ncbi:MAG: glycosyltransferase family 39 protein [Planctomycetes bacterium]|nr:glycosyltransferase family 39 protein [Planctomycetota bacterium]